MKYIDSHTHIGDCRISDIDVSEEQLIDSLNQVDPEAMAIVQPFPCSSDEDEVHERIYRMAQQYPGRIFGLASVYPHIPREKLEAKLRHYIQDYGFVGIKVNTVGHAIPPNSRDAYTLYEIAAKYGVAVNVHTGIGVPFSLPSLCLEPTSKFPELNFVLAHSGSMVFSAEALEVAKQRKNIYLETSWCVIDDSAEMVRALGSERVMIGSDSLRNFPYEVYKYRLLNLTEKQQQDVFYRTAAKAFGINSLL